MRQWMGIGFAATAFLAVAANAQNADWRTYVNARFGTSIDYPANLFDPQPPEENGDGQRFKARDGAEFTISAAYNVLQDTLQSLEQSLLHPEGGPDDVANVTDRLSKANMLILSRGRGDQIYYDKFLFTKEQETIHHLAIAYPAAKKDTYKPIVERMSESMAYGE
jgi:hypothetical protein